MWNESLPDDPKQCRPCSPSSLAGEVGSEVNPKYFYGNISRVSGAGLMIKPTIAHFKTLNVAPDRVYLINARGTTHWKIQRGRKT